MKNKQMETAPNNQYMDYSDGYYGPIDPVWVAEHDKRYVEKTQQLVDSIKKEWSSATNEGRYEMLQLNCVERGPDLAEHMNGGNAIKSAAVWFDGLTELAESTDSVYLRRYIDWRKNIEVHNVIGESMYGYAEVDTASPKYDAARHQQLFDYFDGLTFDEPTDIPHKYTEVGEVFVSALPPKERALYDWGLRMMQEKPATALDSDYYPPSPFTALAAGISGDENFKKLPGKELELALETLHVFELQGIGDISERARSQLYHMGLGLDEPTYNRLAQASKALTHEGRVVFAEAFLAIEFGDDLGKIILNIAEMEPQKSTEIFEKLQNVRRNGESIAAHFGSEKGINKAVGVAFIKRATELLALAEAEGSDSMVEELRLLDDVVEQIAEAVDNDSFEVVNIDESAEFGTLQAENSKVTVTARLHGNAPRLGMTVRYPKGQRVNIRLDYEHGTMSLDIGQTSTRANKADMSRLLGSALARGELAISKRRAEVAIEQGEQRQEITLHGNHVREAFEPIGEVMPEEFAGFVNTFLYSLKMQQGSTDLETAA